MLQRRWEWRPNRIRGSGRPWSFIGAISWGIVPCELIVNRKQKIISEWESTQLEHYMLLEARNYPPCWHSTGNPSGRQHCSPSPRLCLRIGESRSLGWRQPNAGQIMSFPALHRAAHGDHKSDSLLSRPAPVRCTQSWPSGASYPSCSKSLWRVSITISSIISGFKMSLI